MLLKRLELQGFKSFADRTVLDFSSGTTAVVGPNGSGKSNISDAVRWVMGEMSAKSLRGSNMQDVIFSGTGKRKRVNFAEVSMTLDNSSHIFDVDYEEIVVTRRVFRSGESVYQLNGVGCRLRDIHELFMDTGLGRDGYSMIGQGEVGKIVSTKAEDRRSFFEEAAGVSKFKYRREEASRKLAGVEENLTRINDIAEELSGQLAPLEKQSEKARKYLSLYGEYKDLDVNMLLRALDSNKEQTDEANSLYDETERELSELREKESEAEARIDGLYVQSREKDEEQARENERLMENEKRAAECSKQVSISENDIANNIQLMNRLDSEAAQTKSKKRDRLNTITENRERIKEYEDEAARIRTEYDDESVKNDELSSRRASIGESIDKNKEEIINRISRAAELKASLSGIEERRRSYLERREAVEHERELFESSLEDTNTRIDESKKNSEDIGKKLEKMRERLNGRTEKLAQLLKKREDNKKILDSSAADRNAKESKKRILEDMENEGYSRSVKAVLNARELKGYAIYGTVASILETDKQYAVAIENAVGGAMQNIVVENEGDAKAAIAYLRNTRAGRATFLPISSVHGRELDNISEISKCAGFIGTGCSLVSYDRKYDGIVKSILGRVVVVDNIDNGIAMSRRFGYKFRTVTLAGDIMNAGGSMSGGSANKNSGFLSRAAEIKSLGREIEALDFQIKKCREYDSGFEDEIKGVNMQIEAYKPMVREYEDELIRTENDLSHLEEMLSTSGSTEEGYQKELEAITEGLKSSAEEISELLSMIRDEENARAALEHETRELEEELEQVSAMREESSDAVMEKTMRMAECERMIKSLDDAVKNAETDILSDDEAIKRAEHDRAELEARNNSIREAINELKEKAESLKGISEQIRKRIADADKGKMKITEQIRGIQNANKELTQTLLELQKELARVDNRRVKLELDRSTAINRLWDDYELTITAAAELRHDPEDEKAASKRLSQLKNEIRALGHVNMEAIEEYKSVSERYKFLTEQKNDLDESKQKLTKLIGSMDGLIKEHFVKQLEMINESFSRIFTELFGGGRARLYLSEPENILESGIEIDVQLPGKGLQNINLYSGGEKAFIATALLFAILDVKPTPFCILDEIDAALDDVNVSKFASYLKNYTDETQFIVITHRRGTMEAANILYGVTMQEKGVSKLLSLHIDDVDESMAE